MSSFINRASISPRKSLIFSKGSAMPDMDDAAYEEHHRRGILRILRTDPASRTNSHISALVDYTQDIRFFKELSAKSSQSAHIACCQHMFYEFFNQSEYLFRYGDQGTKFFIIIKGKVSIQIPTLNNDAGTYELVEALQLGDGAAFGELALEDTGKTRAASIQCLEDSHFAVIEKSDFKRILFKMIQDKRMELVNFLNSLPMFKSWTKGSLTKLSYFFKEKQFVRNQVVYKEGEPAEEVYVVKEGEFKFNKKIQVQPIQKFKTRSKLSSITKQNPVHLNDVCILGKGEIFGEDEVIEDKKRNFSCVCHSISAALFVISKADFLKRLKNEETWKYVNEKSTLKQSWVSQRINYATNLEEAKTRNSPPTISRPQNNRPAPIQPLKFRSQFFSPNESLKDFSHTYTPITIKCEDNTNTDKTNKEEVHARYSKEIQKKRKSLVVMNHNAISTDTSDTKILVFSGSTNDTDLEIPLPGRASFKSSPKSGIKRITSKFISHTRSKSLNVDNQNVFYINQGSLVGQETKNDLPAKYNTNGIHVNGFTRFQNLFYGTLKNRPTHFLSDGCQLKI